MNDMCSSADGRDEWTDESEEPPGSGRALRPEVSLFLRRWYPESSLSDWNNWRWQLRNRITSLTRLERLLTLSPEERAALKSSGVGSHSTLLPTAITPYYASLLDPRDSNDPLRRTVVPTMAELHHSPEERPDPLDEERDAVVPGLVHRYPDRVLFLVTNSCAVYCRYCTRSRMVGSAAAPDRWKAALGYIRAHREVRDVLLSGGDPLTLPNGEIAYLLRALREMPHVEIIRIGTKVPVVLPQRITEGLLTLLRGYHPLWMSIHVTHPAEITPEMRAATGAIADAGIPMGSQTVLLKGINDDVQTMKRLNQALLTCRVRPYYLYQCDQIPGSAQFRTPLSRGIEIVDGLRGHTSGYAVPHFVLDLPHGGGKVPFLPDYLVRRDTGSIEIRNYRGQEYSYEDLPEI